MPGGRPKARFDALVVVVGAEDVLAINFSRTATAGKTMATGGTTTGGTTTGGTTTARGRKKQQHHHHQHTNHSNIVRMFTSPDNVDLFKLIYSI
jgi:hypothetical protein